METMQLFGVGIFWLAYYYFVLRKYNTLGFRMFSLFFFTGVCVCCWWYADDQDLKDVQTHGIATQALVIKKAENSLEFSFKDHSGHSTIRRQTGGISVEEFASVSEGKGAPILYSSESDMVFLKSSYQRQLSDNVYILILPGILFIIGIASFIFLRKYRVHAHEGTMYEYVTDESGKIVLDDARNSTTKSLRTFSTMSKLLRLFDK
jgi:hypothetical protein